MKKILLILFGAIVFLTSCTQESSKNKIATIVGKVGYIENQTFYPLDSVRILVPEFYAPPVYSNDLGEFVVEIELENKNDEASVTMFLSRSNGGFNSTSVSTQVKGGETTYLTDDVLLVSSGSLKSTAKITGTIIDANDNSPLENVAIIFSGQPDPIYSDITGFFDYDYPLDEGVSNLTITVSLDKGGYLAKNLTNVRISTDNATNLGSITLVPNGNDTLTTAGEPYALLVDNIELNHIYITESGLPEVTKITLTVIDIRGEIIDNNHRQLVNAEIVSGPDGAENLYPAQAETNDGKVTFYLRSGTRAGVVQMRFWFEREGTGEIAKVEPVQIAIWGGFPVQRNFSVGVQKLNIAGLVWLGLTDKFTAYLGDKYNNPVAPGTAVYFTSEYCYIEGSAVTNKLGLATVTFVAAAQYPVVTPATPDEAFVTIYADTKGQPDPVTGESVIVQGQNRVLLSALTAGIDVYYKDNVTNNYILMDASTILNYDTVANMGYDFRMTVSDIYGNPLVKNSIIGVSSNIGDVDGDTQVKFSDIAWRGYGATEFTFSWAAPTPNEISWGKIATITITVKTPDDGNGNLGKYFKIFP